MPIRKRSIGLLTFSAVCVTSPAAASESVVFTYDALGRLTESRTTGGPNGALNHNWLLDPAGNRATLTVTGSANKGRPDAPVLTVPLNGFTLLPIELR